MRINLLQIFTITHVNRSQKHSFLRCAYHLLYFCPVVGAKLAVNRLMKATISILSPLYLRQPRTESSPGASGQSRASKKRRREYEVDNVLSVTNITVCATANECDTLMVALDGEHLNSCADIWLFINLVSYTSMYAECGACCFHPFPCDPSASVHPIVTSLDTTFKTFIRS